MMGPPLKAGLAYVAVIFALGVAFGLLRVLVLVPEVGETAALLVELPVMVVASWFACRWCVERFDVDERIASRFVMGAVAFGLLMIGELAVSVVALGRSPAEHLAASERDSALPCLVAQLLFAAMPLLQRWWFTRPASSRSA